MSDKILRCGAPECTWEIVFPNNDEDWPECYTRIKDHYLDFHGMDPKVSSIEEPLEITLSIS